MPFNKTIFEFLNMDFIDDCTIFHNSSQIETYELPPKWGEGSFRIIHLGNGAEMVISDCSLSKNYSYTLSDDTLIHIAHFKEVHCIQNCPHTHCKLNTDTFYCQLGCCGNFQSVYEKKSRVKSIHIFLTHQYYKTYLSKNFPNIHFPLKKIALLLHGNTYFPELASIFHQLYNYHQTDEFSLLFYHSKTNEIISKILHHLSKTNTSFYRPVRQSDCTMIHSIAEYICSHLAQDTSIESLSYMACMSPAKLKYVFKSVFHCSIRDFRLKKRIEIAEELLCSTDCGICEIASRLGYQTAGSFSDMFKKYTGFSPKSYRVLHKTAPNKNSAAN